MSKTPWAPDDVSSSNPPSKELTMSFQAYLDNIEDKTGLTPRQFIDLAAREGLRLHPPRRARSWPG